MLWACRVVYLLLVFSCGFGSNREDIRRFSFTKNFRKLPWKGPSSEERVPFDSSSVRLNALVTKFKMVAQISTWIAWNWSLHVKTRKGNMHFLRKNSNKKTGLPFKIPLILWNFPVERNFLVNGKRWSSSIGLLRMPWTEMANAHMVSLVPVHSVWSNNYIVYIYPLYPSCKTSYGCER